MKQPRIVRLDDIARVVSGGTPSRSNPAYWGGDVPWVKTAEIRNGRIRREDVGENITTAGLKHSAARVIPSGTILMAMYGQGDTRGRVAVLELDAAINQACAAFLLQDGVDRDYVFQFLKSQYDCIRRLSNTGSQDNLSAGLIRSLHVPLPPLDEQRRIAEVLCTWDEAIEKTERLLTTKRQRVQGLVQEITYASTAERPIVGHLGDFCTMSKGSGLSKEAVRPNGTSPCILYGELYTVYGEVVENVVSRTNTSASVVSFGDEVLIPASTTTTGEDLANATALREPAVLLGGDINILRPRRPGLYDAEYLAYYLTHAKKREIVRLAQGSTIVHLYGRDIATLTVELPDLGTQQRAAATFAQARREIDLLARLKQQYELQRRGLEQRLLTPPDTLWAAS